MTTPRSRVLPARLRLVGALVGLQLLFLGLGRLVFLSFFAPAQGTRGLGEALWIGTRFDLRLALVLAGPLLLLSWSARLDPARSTLAARAWVAVLTASQGLVFLLYAVDVGHYAYLGDRLSLQLVDQVLDPTIAAGMVWETYPVVPIALALLAATGAFGFLLSRAFRRGREPDAARRSRLGRTLAWSAALALYAFGLWGKASWYPLRWSDAFFDGPGFTADLALNPILYLYETAPNREAPYDTELAAAARPTVLHVLDLEGAAAEGLSLAREVQPRSTPPEPLNLVLIHLESWAAYKCGAFGNPLSPSPYFDALADRSLLFTRFFVCQGPTASSIFTVFTGLPDLNPVRTASRNPELVRQHCLVNYLEGYARHYFLGGSANWANIRALLSNITGLVFHEEGDFDGAAREDVWGVSDLTLLKEAHRVFEAQTEPFFAFVQTSGNHRPYTIPTETDGFELRTATRAELDAGGFRGEDALNGFRFLDHALGRFFEEAASADYYGRTVFVLYGDHGVPGPADTPFGRMQVSRYHVPLLIHAPGVDARRLSSPASSADILPTALSLMGVAYVNTTIGRDLLDPRVQRAPFAYVRKGVLFEDRLYRAKATQRLYSLEAENLGEELGAAEPERLRAAGEVYAAFNEWCRWAMYHNEPLPRAGNAGGR